MCIQTTATGKGLHYPYSAHRSAPALRELRPRGVRGGVGGVLHRQPARGGLRPPVQANEVKSRVAFVSEYTTKPLRDIFVQKVLIDSGVFSQ